MKLFPKAMLIAVAFLIFIGLVLGVLYLPDRKPEIPPMSEVSTDRDFDLKQNVTLRTEKEKRSVRLNRRKQENLPIEISDKENILWFWSYHPDEGIELTISFRDKSGEEIDKLFEWSRRHIKLMPKAFYPPDLGRQGGPPEILLVKPKSAEIRKKEFEGIEFWVFVEGDTVKLPVVLGKDLQPRPAPTVAEEDSSR
jgi:hypothetical protein